MATGWQSNLLRGNNLLQAFSIPEPAKTLLAVALMDYTLYLWHILTHKNAKLWKFHVVHHIDLDLVASTVLRFHFGELFISVALRTIQVLLLGIGPQALRTWQTFLMLCILFHHSNIRLPKTFEKQLSKLIVTPRLHGVHHSIVPEEVNSNWSSGLTI